MGHARSHTPDEDHLWRNARLRHSRSPDLLRRLQVQPFHPDERRSLARRCPAVGHRTAVRLQGLREARRRSSGALRARQDGHGLMRFTLDHLTQIPKAAVPRACPRPDGAVECIMGRTNARGLSWSMKTDARDKAHTDLRRLPDRSRQDRRRIRIFPLRCMRGDCRHRVLGI
jgi:hypothetical protein